MPLNSPLGPKSTLCLISQSVESSVPGSSLCILMKTETPNVPYGTTFYSQGRVCICATGERSSRCFVSYRVVFTKPNLLRGELPATTKHVTMKKARSKKARRRVQSSFIQILRGLSSAVCICPWIRTRMLGACLSDKTQTGRPGAWQGHFGKCFRGGDCWCSWGCRDFYW